MLRLAHVGRILLRISRPFADSSLKVYSGRLPRICERQKWSWRCLYTPSGVCRSPYTDVPNSEWIKRLTPEQYYVCREQGTEEPFSGLYYSNDEEGIYKCVCCGSDLFSSESKYDSGCGWPSFTSAIGSKGLDESETNIMRRSDNSHGMTRTEVICKQCDSHLGHVFDDGPPPTGLRFCINSVSLKFEHNEPE